MTRASIIRERPAVLLATRDPRTGKFRPFSFHRVENAEPDIILVDRDGVRAWEV